MGGSYRATDPQKGGGWMAKRSCNVWQCEVNRFFKLTKNSVIPISFRVPRKSGADVFQEDIYPDTYAGKAAMTDDDGSTYTFEKKKTYQELDEENKALKARVKEL